MPKQKTDHNMAVFKSLLEEVTDDTGFADADDAKQHKNKVPKDALGRPTVMTKSALSKLEYASKIGCSDQEACQFANISPSALYRYCKKHDQFRKQKKLWKDNYLVMRSRMNIAKAIFSGDVALSTQILFRKRRDEFSEKKVIEIERPVTLDQLEDDDFDPERPGSGGQDDDEDL